MATLQTNPSSVPDAVQEWTRELNISELGRVGYKNINYTLWNETSTAVPEVIEGSIIEINNSTYVELSDVALDITGQTVDAINWVIYEVAGSIATAYLKPTAPTASDYDVEKGGFYNGSGHRWTGDYMFVSPAGTAFSNKGYLDYANGAMLKYRIDDEADDFVIDSKLDVKETLNVDGNTTLGGTLTAEGDITSNSGNLHIDGTGASNIDGTLSIGSHFYPDPSPTASSWSGTSTFIVPRGIFMVSFSATNAGYFQMTAGAGVSNVLDALTEDGGMIVSDGAGDVVHQAGAGGTVYYLQF